MGLMIVVGTQDLGLFFREDCGDYGGQMQEGPVIVASSVRGECGRSFATREPTRSRC